MASNSTEIDVSVAPVQAPLVSPYTSANKVATQSASAIRTILPTSSSTRRRRDTSVTRQGKLGSRKHQRWLNKNFLLEQNKDLSGLSELDFTLIYPHRPNTGISSMFHNDRTKEMLLQFVNVTEDRQNQLLASMGIFQPSANNQSKYALTPTHAYKRIDKRIRKLLLRTVDTEFFGELDKEICRFLINEPENNNRSYIFEDSYQRLICHGICQYYQLRSHSEDFEDGRRVIVHRPVDVPVLSTTLSAFIATIIVTEEPAGMDMEDI